MKLSDTHIGCVTENKVKEVTKPFFDISGIDYFFYTEFFKTGHTFCLSTNAQWFKTFYELDLHKLTPNFPANGYRLCEVSNPIIAANAKTHFNIQNYLILTKEFDDHYLMAGFGTTYPNEAVSDYYINNRDILDKFIYYFKQKAADLIIESKQPQNIIALPEYSKSGLKLAFVDSKPLHFLNLNSLPLMLSKREQECISYFLQGDTIRSTADKLFISPRTVETHLDNIKNKLGCHKKSELIALLIKNGFTRYTAF
jgi:LuxR family quorum-sensing system transcriptional regulator SolR